MYSNKKEVNLGMFFVLSINTRSQTAKIVSCAKSLEEAIEETREAADHYVLTKSKPMLHRDQDQSNYKVYYFSKDSVNGAHQIDVYRQQNRLIQSWFNTSVTESVSEPRLVRRFMYCTYDTNGSGTESSPEAPPVPPPPPTLVTKVPTTKKTFASAVGFPQSVMTDLIDNEKFKRHRQTTEENCRAYADCAPRYYDEDEL